MGLGPYKIFSCTSQSFAFLILCSNQKVLLPFCTCSGLFYNGTTGHLTCFNITSEFIECADPTGCGTGPASLSWDYQVYTVGPLNSGHLGDIEGLISSVPYSEVIILLLCKDRCPLFRVSIFRGFTRQVLRRSATNMPATSRDSISRLG